MRVLLYMGDVVYKKILLTHDGSSIASQAIPHAVALAHGLNTEIFLFRVVPAMRQEILTAEPMGMVLPIPTLGQQVTEMVEENKEEAQKKLLRIQTQLEGLGARKVTPLVAEGVAEEEIVKIAKKEHIDLIVMSTHGRSGLGRALLGSVADFVVRHASCPVLLIRARQ